MVIEQGLFKAMVLTSLKHGEKNARDIYDHITKKPYSYTGKSVEYLDIVYEDSIESLRVELVYLRKHGYIKKTNKQRPFRYILTKLGKQNQEKPFKFTEIFEERVEKEVKKRTESMKAEIKEKVNAEVEKITAGLAPLNEEIVESNVIEVRKSEEEFATAVEKEVQKRITNMMGVSNSNEQVKKGSTLYLGYNNEVILDCDNGKCTFDLKVANGIPKFE